MCSCERKEREIGRMKERERVCVCVSERESLKKTLYILTYRMNPIEAALCSIYCQNNIDLRLRTLGKTAFYFGLWFVNAKGFFFIRFARFFSMSFLVVFFNVQLLVLHGNYVIFISGVLFLIHILLQWYFFQPFHMFVCTYFNALGKVLSVMWFFLKW